MTYSADDRPGGTDRSRSASGQPAGALDQRVPANGPTTSTAGRSTDQPTGSLSRSDPGQPTSAGSPGPNEPREDAAPSSSPARDRRHDHLAGSVRPTQDIWVVEQGDSFWSVAAETLADRAGGTRDAPDDGEVERYWRVLVDANRSRMPDPTNPDLLIPGQELALPPS
jgi:hypothetical protein